MDVLDFETEPSEVVEATLDLVGVVLGSLAGGTLGFLVALILGAVLVWVGKRRDGAKYLTKHSRGAIRATLTSLGLYVGYVAATRLPEAAAIPQWRPMVRHLLLLLMIVSVTWLVASLVRVIEDAVVRRVTGDREDADEDVRLSNYARRVQTQSEMLRRLGVVIVWIVGLAVALFTFEGARAAGASLLASAGIMSVVAGFAAQSVLGNLFAGIQLAFTDAIRVDDVVVVEDEYGYIEEITLNYVVLRTWDARRIVLPSTYFASEPFENWTRREPKLLGTVSWDVDWSVPIGLARLELERIVKSTDLWDGRSANLQVIDAINGYVHLRATVSAKDAGDLWDLRTHTRERMVDWLATNATYALPRQRQVNFEAPMDPPIQSRADVSAIADDDMELADLEDQHRPAPRTKPEKPAKAQISDAERRVQEFNARRVRRRAARADRRRARFSKGALGLHDQIEQVPPSSDETAPMDLQTLEEMRLSSVSSRSAPEPGELEESDDANDVDEPSGDRPVEGTSPRRVSVGTLMSAATPNADSADPDVAEAKREDGLRSASHATDRFSSLSRMYSGSENNEERGELFSGPSQEEMREREEEAERRREKAKESTDEPPVTDSPEDNTERP